MKEISATETNVSWLALTFVNSLFCVFLLIAIGLLFRPVQNRLPQQGRGSTGVYSSRLLALAWRLSFSLCRQMLWGLIAQFRDFLAFLCPWEVVSSSLPFTGQAASPLCLLPGPKLTEYLPAIWCVQTTGLNFSFISDNHKSLQNYVKNSQNSFI